MTNRVALAVLVALPLAACDRRSAGSASGTATPTATVAAVDSSYRLRPGYVVDSILPIEEELRRFRAGLADTPTVLSGGARSREALVRSLFEGLARGDTGAVRRLIVDRAEFAWLVYPSSPYTKPPYRQPPALVWMQLRLAGTNGFTRLFDRYAGGALAYVDHRCDPTPAVEGENRLWRNCRARVVRTGRDTVSGRWFGVIIERAGRFKFASLANQL